jgi:hypothetical protein
MKQSLAIKYIPQIKNKPELISLWEEIFNERKIKVEKKRAVHSANAVVYSKMIKEFEKEAYIKAKKFLIEEKNICIKEKKYNFYKINNRKIYITTDRTILKDPRFENVEGKGMIKGDIPLDHQELLNKLIDNETSKYDIDLNIDPKIPTYYVIEGDK